MTPLLVIIAVMTVLLLAKWAVDHEPRQAPVTLVPLDLSIKPEPVTKTGAAWEPVTVWAEIFEEEDDDLG